MNEDSKLAFDVEFMNCVIDKEDNLCVLDSDKHFSDFVGVHPSKIKQGKLFFHDLLVPQDRERIMQILCKKNSPHIYFDFKIKQKNGDYSLVHCTGDNMPDTSYCHLTMADITRSVEREKALKAKAKEMNHLIDLVTGGVCLFKVNQNMQFEVLYANEACCRYFGTTKDQIVIQDHKIDELIHPEDKSRAFQAIGSSMATKKPIDTELRIITHKDDYMWCKMDAAIQRYDKDNCPIFHAIFSDITKLKQAEEEAEKQKEMLMKVLKNVPGPLFVTDFSNPFKLSVVSEDFVKLTGYSRAELFGRFDGDLTNLIVSREVEIAQKAIRSQADKPVMKTTYSIKTSKGKQLIVVDKRKVIELDSGEKSMIGMLRDVTSMHLDDTFDL